MRTIERNDAHTLLDSRVQKPDGKVVGRAVDMIATRAASRVKSSSICKAFWVSATARSISRGTRSASRRRAKTAPITLNPSAVPAESGQAECGDAAAADRRDRRAFERRAKVGRVIDVLIDASAQPQAVVLDVNGMVSTERRTIAANWSALRFVTKDKELHPLIDLSDAQINAAPPYASDKPIRAVSPAPPAAAAAPASTATAPAAAAPTSVLRPRRPPRPVQTHGRSDDRPHYGYRAKSARTRLAELLRRQRADGLRSVHRVVSRVAQVDAGRDRHGALGGHDQRDGEPVPGGAAVDALRNKKGAAAWAIFAIIVSAVLLATSPTVLPVIAAEVFHGLRELHADAGAGRDFVRARRARESRRPARAQRALGVDRQRGRGRPDGRVRRILSRRARCSG